MWPYVKKTPLRYHTSTVSLHGNCDFVLERRSAKLEKEYYKKLTMSSRARRESYTAYKVEDGRVLRLQGTSNQDITREYLIKDQTSRGRVDLPARQLHNRNLRQLKIVLDMPPEKSAPLAHLTGAILNNDVAPSLTQLDNDIWLNEDLKKSASAPRLPPIRHLDSLEKAQWIERMAKTAPQNANDPYRQSSNEYSSDKVHFRGNFYDICPENNVNLPITTKDHQSFNTVSKTRAFRMGPINKHIKRLDSVGRISNHIHEQFRALVLNQKNTMEEDRNMYSREGYRTTSVNSVCNSLTKPIIYETKKPEPSGFKLRQEYGKNLERNWFLNEYLKRRQSRDRRESIRNTQINKGSLRLDMFYSPEPESETDSDNVEDVDNSAMEDECSLKCRAVSVASTMSRFYENFEKSNENTMVSDEHGEEAEDTDDGRESSEGEYEMILKDNQLIQKKTKHKMRRKRKRQLKRYKAFMESSDNPETEIVALPDHEIRALRLNIRPKDKSNKLSGKRKFLQVANAIFVAVQFRKLLCKIRTRKKLLAKKRKQRLMRMVAKRFRAKLSSKDENEKKTLNLKTNLKEQFLREMGQKLIYDVQQLNIYTVKENDKRKYNVDEGENYETVNEKQIDAKRVTNYETEMRKVSLSDLKGVDMIRKTRKLDRRYRRRRHSIPRVSRPTDFLLEVPEKRRKRHFKRHLHKESRRPASPPRATCRCTCYNPKPEDKTLKRTEVESCPHQPEIKKPKIKTVLIPTRGLMRTFSLDNLAKRRPVELDDLLKDIDIPAKEIRLQILARKFRRQRKKRKQIRLSPVRLPERHELQQEDKTVESESSETLLEDEDSDVSDYDFEYGGPFVGCGVMWNQNSYDRKRRTWTDEEVDREIKRITRMFYELKECRYLRMDSLSEAIAKRLQKTSTSTI